MKICFLLFVVLAGAVSVQTITFLTTGNGGDISVADANNPPHINCFQKFHPT